MKIYLKDQAYIDWRPIPAGADEAAVCQQS